MSPVRPMRIQLPLVLWLLATQVPQEPPTAPPATPIPATRLQTRWAAQVTLVPASDRQAQTWRYTTDTPPAAWFESGFDESGWRTGPGGFGTRDTRFARVGTEWRTPDIWIRRAVDVPAGPLTAPHLRVFHDDDARVYLNGVLAAEIAGANAGFAYVPLTGTARAALRPGRNVLAVHTRQNRGRQFIDVGLVDVIEPGPAR